MNNIAQILGQIGENGTMPSELQNKTYKSMMDTYDTVDDMLAGLEKYGNVADPYIKNLQKLIDTIEKNNEIMINNFFKYMESGKALSGIEKLKIENSVKTTRIAIQQFLSKIN